MSQDHRASAPRAPPRTRRRSRLETAGSRAASRAQPPGSSASSQRRRDASAGNAGRGDAPAQLDGHVGAAGRIGHAFDLRHDGIRGCGVGRADVDGEAPRSGTTWRAEPPRKMPTSRAAPSASVNDSSAPTSGASARRRSRRDPRARRWALRPVATTLSAPTAPRSHTTPPPGHPASSPRHAAAPRARSRSPCPAPNAAELLVIDHDQLDRSGPVGAACISDGRDRARGHHQASLHVADAGAAEHRPFAVTASRRWCRPARPCRRDRPRACAGRPGRRRSSRSTHPRGVPRPLNPRSISSVE